MSSGSQTLALVCSRGVAEGWGEFGVADPGVLVCLEPPSPVGLGRGRFELCALPRHRFLTTGGAEFYRLS